MTLYRDKNVRNIGLNWFESHAAATTRRNNTPVPRTWHMRPYVEIQPRLYQKPVEALNPKPGSSTATTPQRLSKRLLRRLRGN